MPALKTVFGAVLIASMALPIPAHAQNSRSLGSMTKLGVPLDVRSSTPAFRTARPVVLPGLVPHVSSGGTFPQIQRRGGNVQVNDAALDHVQIFSDFPPFIFVDQAEVSLTAYNHTIVATYNSGAGNILSLDPSGQGLIFQRGLSSGYSVSNDDGVTWKSGFIPPVPGVTFTDGDPSLGVDRHGNFYFSNLAEDDAHTFVQFNKSSDGSLWEPGIILEYDDDGGFSDKDWLAVGPDPVKKSRDNVYVTWTKFYDTGCELHFARSIDTGLTWTVKSMFVPTADPDPTHPQNCLQASNPVVDSVTGNLYVPFLRLSNSDQDFIQMLVSDDAGETFRFATFNVAGAPDTSVMPFTQPGEFTSCGRALAITIHGSANPGPGLFGLPRYINATRILSQPALAARNGVLYLAWSASTSRFFSDPAGSSNVLFMRSDDGGRTWNQPVIVNPLSSDKHHVMPALAIDNGGNGVHVTYYTQHADDTIDLDMANSSDGGTTFPSGRNVRVSSTSINLPPSNIPLSDAPDFLATNYTLATPCYALGEYQSVSTANGLVYAGWGDSRRLVTEPVNALDPISGQTHPQQDVFVQKVKAD